MPAGAVSARGAWLWPDVALGGSFRAGALTCRVSGGWLPALAGCEGEGFGCVLPVAPASGLEPFASGPLTGACIFTGL